MNRKINSSLKMYSCNTNKNVKCNKRNCGSYCKYAKKNLINFVNKIINKIRGDYKYE